MVLTNFFTVADFQTILDEFGRLVTHIPITRTTSNFSGQETLTEGSSVQIQAYAEKYGSNYDYEKAGFIEKGDMAFLSKYADGVVKDDLILLEPQTSQAASTVDGDPTQIQIIFAAVHSLVVGDVVQITGTTNYDGSFTVTTVTNPTQVRCLATGHDYAPESTGVIYYNFTKYRVKEAFDVASIFDNTSATGTTYSYTACNLFLQE